MTTPNNYIGKTTYLQEAYIGKTTYLQEAYIGKTTVVQSIPVPDTLSSGDPSNRTLVERPA